MRQKTYLKAQKCSKFHRRVSLHDRMFKLIIHAKAKGWVFPYKFWSYFIGRGFASRAKRKVDLELILYITIFVFLSPGSCFKSVICIQNSLESVQIIMFLLLLKEGKIIHQKGLRAQFSLIFHSEAN